MSVQALPFNEGTDAAVISDVMLKAKQALHVEQVDAPEPLQEAATDSADLGADTTAGRARGEAAALDTGASDQHKPK